MAVSPTNTIQLTIHTRRLAIDILLKPFKMMSYFWLDTSQSKSFVGETNTFLLISLPSRYQISTLFVNQAAFSCEADSMSRLFLWPSLHTGGKVFFVSSLCRGSHETSMSYRERGRGQKEKGVRVLSVLVMRELRRVFVFWKWERCIPPNVVWVVLHRSISQCQT